jgi:hypothetical protein
MRAAPQLRSSFAASSKQRRMTNCGRQKSSARTRSTFALLQRQARPRLLHSRIQMLSRVLTGRRGRRPAARDEYRAPRGSFESTKIGIVPAPAVGLDSA